MFGYIYTRTHLDKLLTLYDPGLVFEEPSSGNDCKDDKVDLLADLPQLSVAMLLQSSLQVFSIKHLRICTNTLLSEYYVYQFPNEQVATRLPIA